MLLQENMWTDPWEYINRSHRHMNVEIGTEAAHNSQKRNTQMGFFVAVYVWTAHTPPYQSGRRRGWWTGSRRSRCPYWATACEQPTTSLLPLLLPPAGWAQPGPPSRRPRPRRACARGRGRGWAAWRSGPWAGWGSGTCPSSGCPQCGWPGSSLKLEDRGRGQQKNKDKTEQKRMKN
jgi:hypothetical protein